MKSKFSLIVIFYVSTTMTGYSCNCNSPEDPYYPIQDFSYEYLILGKVGEYIGDGLLSILIIENLYGEIQEDSIILYGHYSGCLDYTDDLFESDTVLLNIFRPGLYHRLQLTNNTENPVTSNSFIRDQCASYPFFNYSKGLLYYNENNILSNPLDSEMISFTEFKEKIGLLEQCHEELILEYETVDQIPKGQIAYIGYTNISDGNYHDLIWNFGDAIVVSGPTTWESNSAPYGVYWETPGLKKIQVRVIGDCDELEKNIEIFVSTPLSAEAENQKLHVFPNPFSKYIYIDSDNQFERYELTDLNGSNLVQGIFEDSKIDLSDIRSGIFLLRLHSKKETIIKKLVKQR